MSRTDTGVQEYLANFALGNPLRVQFFYRFYVDTAMKVFCRGLKKQFEDHYVPAQLLTDNRLTPDRIAVDIIKQTLS